MGIKYDLQYITLTVAYESVIQNFCAKIKWSKVLRKSAHDMLALNMPCHDQTHWDEYFQSEQLSSTLWGLPMLCTKQIAFNCNMT